jgi:hypothetical protein
MKSFQFRKYEMLRRVQHYLDDGAAALAGVNATAARKEFDAIVKDIGQNVTREAASGLGARSQTAKLKVLRRELWSHHLRRVATIAAAHLRQVPEFQALKMPGHKVKAPVVVQAAMAMAEAARAYAQVFVENGRTPDFADALVAAAEAMRVAVDARGESIGDKAAARNCIKVSGARASVVLQLLDAQVKSALADDPQALAKWKSVRKIGNARVGSAAVTPLPGPTPTPEVKAA